MSHPQQLLDYWADLERWSADRDPLDWPVSSEFAEKFEKHLSRLQPIAASGNTDAVYALATIYQLGLIYPDEASHRRRFPEGSKRMTILLSKAAQAGEVHAFDILVTSGVGELAKLAREAAEEYEHNHKPDWDAATNMPVYTPSWMEGAMRIWLQGIGEQ